MLKHYLIPIVLSGVIFLSGGALTEPPEHIVDKDLQSYVTEYYKLLETRCPSKKMGIYPRGNYTIKLGSAEGDTWVGICYWNGDGYEITIDQDYWFSRSTPNSRIHLMNHELSHCVLGKMHVDDVNHYMNWELTPVPTLQLQSQLLEDMEAFCNE